MTGDSNKGCFRGKRGRIVYTSHGRTMRSNGTGAWSVRKKIAAKTAGLSNVLEGEYISAVAKR